MLTLSPNSTTRKDSNEFSAITFKQKLINSPVNGFNFSCGIFLYNEKKSNVEIEIALILEFYLLATSMAV